MARELEKTGWQVYLTDAAGSRFAPQNFGRLLSINREMQMDAPSRFVG
jgi:hypothetical protein